MNKNKTRDEIAEALAELVLLSSSPDEVLLWSVVPEVVPEVVADWLLVWVPD